MSLDGDDGGALPVETDSIYGVMVSTSGAWANFNNDGNAVTTNASLLRSAAKRDVDCKMLCGEAIGSKGRASGHCGLNCCCIPLTMVVKVVRHCSKRVLGPDWAGVASGVA